MNYRKNKNRLGGSMLKRITIIKIYLLFIFLMNSFLNYSSAQVQLDWVRTYQGPITGSGIDVMTIDENDFLYVSGVSVSSAIAYDIATIKYNKYGDSLWVRRYSSNSQCQVNDIEVDNNGNVYVTGYSLVGATPKALTIKYGQNGEVLWEKLYDSSPDNRSIGVGIDQSGYVYIAGSSNKNGTDWGVEVVKYNPDNGDTIWTARYDQSENSVDIPRAMEVDLSGNVYVCGSVQSDSLYSFLVKFNSNGEKEWASLYKRPGIQGEIYGEVLKLDAAGNIYFAGHCYNGPATFVDYLIAKYNPDGNYEWITTYSNTNNGIDEAYDLAVDEAGNVFVTGKSFIGGGGSSNYDYLTVKFSPNGNQIWQARYNNDPEGPTQDEAYAIAVDPYGNSYVTGVSSKSHLYNNEGFATVKYDKDGNEVWRIRHDEWWYCFGFAIVIDSDNMPYVGGRMTSQFALLKYSQPPVPVELISFNAVINNSSVELKWSTASESNNKGFEIERSRRDGKWEMENGIWKVIGFVEGKGTTTELQIYSFIDENLPTGRYQYRLKQIDLDGTFEYSNIIEVEISLPGEFSLSQNYPNPFNPTTSIEYRVGSIKKVTLKVYDVLGNQVAALVDEEKEPGVYEVEFNPGNLSSGVYYYRFKAGDFVETKKMIFIK